MAKMNVKSCMLGLPALLCSISMAGQFTDNFDDGDFEHNPTWTDDSSAYLVNTNGMLQLNAKAIDGRSYIYIPLNNTVETWEFNVKMDFNPSSTSYCKVFLMADQPKPANIVQGYFLKIGSTNDDICLYRKEGNAEILLINGRDKMLNTSTVNSSIKVTRGIEGNWELLCDTTGSTDYKWLGSSSDNSLQQLNFFVIECVYIASRSTKFCFDDFRITSQEYSDGTIPTLARFRPLSKTKLECSFSEPIPIYTKEGFLLNDSIIPQTIEALNDRLIITFPYPFSCEDNKLLISGISDKWKNSINDTLVRFTYCTPGLFDIVFNEIMADPSPAVGLPDAEYLELYNRSSKCFRTENWRLTVGTTSYAIPDTQFMPGSYIIICAKTAESAFRKFGTAFGTFTSATTLNNSGQTLHLLDSDDQLIAWAEYSDTWYNDDYKAEGGWSLEQIDPRNPCTGKDNWIASKSKTGGTPGVQNSVFTENKDTEAPEIRSIYVSNDTTILITYNEPLLSLTTIKAENFRLTAEIAPKKTELTGNAYQTLQLTVTHPMEPGKIYPLTITPSIKDCVGNLQNTAKDTLVGIPSACDSLDIVINEVLFNSLPNNPEYIELYNRSDKILDASNLVFTFESPDGRSTFVASQEPFLFYPHSYLVFSPAPELLPAVYSHCNIKNIRYSAAWKSLNDKTGTITLLSRNLQVIDRFMYSETMHQASLTSKEGVSLERISQDMAANYPGNWHSAAETVQYGTPGLQNSQYIEESPTTETFTIEDEIFSPDDDGYHDVLKVNFHFDKPGNRITAWIFDAVGRKVTCLMNNALPENNGFFTWDGNSDKGKLCSPGMYMVFIQLVTDIGETREFKKACILAMKR
ncbi:MAG TPA: lamin tail domain-containing protein [Bacteroidales bacterium]|nr:lamin tail domain-containing protein [Bacteroidales bacterium]